MMKKIIVQVEYPLSEMLGIRSIILGFFFIVVYLYIHNEMS
jgi:hypothetical protein